MELFTIVRLQQEYYKKTFIYDKCKNKTSKTLYKTHLRKL